MSRYPTELVTVRVAKPRALLYAASAGAVITRGPGTPAVPAVDGIPVTHKYVLISFAL